MARDYYTTGPRVPAGAGVERMGLDRLTIAICEGIRDHHATQDLVFTTDGRERRVIPATGSWGDYAVAHRGTHRLGPSVPGARLTWDKLPS